MRQFSLVKLTRFPALLILTPLLLLFLSSAFARDLSVLESDLLGQSYANDSEIERVTRLEQALGVNPNAGDTLELRLNRLYLTENSQISSEAHRAAVSAYNAGVDASQQGQIEQAVQLYQKSISLDPTLVPPYNNLASVLEQNRRYDEAIALYQRAIKLGGHDADTLYRNLGVVYEKQGNLSKSLEAYQQYLSKTSNPDPTIRNVVQQMTAKASAPDYVTLAKQGTQGRNLLWPRDQMPIPVYIQLDQDQIPFLLAIYEGMKSWETGSQGLIRFREVSNPNQAHITIKLADGPLTHPNMDVGHAQYQFTESNSQRDLRVFITVNTGERYLAIPLQERLTQVKKLTLHELGHAIGIWGHSNHPGDIMFSRPIVTQLSQRDCNTLIKLYTPNRL